MARNAKNGTSMQQNVDRIYTSQTGSLPRPRNIIEILKREENGESYDGAELDRLLASAVADVVGRQVAVGLDIVSDGEFSKASYGTYIQQRMTGFGEVDASRRPP